MYTVSKGPKTTIFAFAGSTDWVRFGYDSYVPATLLASTYLNLTMIKRNLQHISHTRMQRLRKSNSHPTCRCSSRLCN